MEDGALKKLSAKDRMRLLRFVCSFAWTDFEIRDEELVPFVFDLLRHEGLFLGGSSGINLAGAVRLAKQLGPGHVIVTVLCDGGERYASRLFNPAFLREKGLPTPSWVE